MKNVSKWLVLCLLARVLLGLGMITVGVLLAMFVYANLPKGETESRYFGTILPVLMGVVLAVIFYLDPMHAIIKGGQKSTEQQSESVD